MNTYSAEVKAQVMAALLAGQSISQVAAEYRIPRGTVGVWSASLKREHKQHPNTKTAIDELLLDYVSELLVTLKVQAEFARDVDYLRKQPASDLAVLHGVLADKGIRILEAAEAARSRDAESVAPSGQPEV